MGFKMQRGKQQVLFNYLPGKTFDFRRIGVIARVSRIRGEPKTNLNATVLLRKIADEARAWQPDLRPVLRDDVLRDPSRFIFLDPRHVDADLFPRVLWCQNRTCGSVFDYSRSDSALPDRCRVCNHPELVQLRFVKIHRCGALEPLTPPRCQHCDRFTQMALDTRGSERLSNFRWICRQCGTRTAIFAGRCNQCQWQAAQPPSNKDPRNMDIELHRAGRTFYAHTAVLLNVPQRELEGFFNINEWGAIAAAKFLGLPEVRGLRLADFRPTGALNRPGDAGLSGRDLDALMARQAAGEITAEQLVTEMQNLRQQRENERQAASPTGILQILVQRTGVTSATWQEAGQELLEAVLPGEIGSPNELYETAATSPAANLARRLGLSRVALVADYPIVTASYAFSRAEYAPNQCRLNPFPHDPDHGGRMPIFVDQVQADALLLTLDANRVLTWLNSNHLTPTLPNGNDPSAVAKAYFVRLFDDVPLRETIGLGRPEARMVFGLLHTFSHLTVRQAALLCGLDRTSLSEYLLPRALTCAIYCNHRFGATIGALTALFEQSLAEWLTLIRDTRRCVYDPVCRDREGNCHACTHLAETSCRFFNLNLSRAFLFGGEDAEMGRVRVGYFDPTLAET